MIKHSGISPKPVKDLPLTLHTTFSISSSVTGKTSSTGYYDQIFENPQFICLLYATTLLFFICANKTNLPFSLFFNITLL